MSARPLTETAIVPAEPPLVLTCYCCGYRYTARTADGVRTGEWSAHPCSGHGRGPSHRWREAWCHLRSPSAAPIDGACGKCPLHCRCATRADLPGVNNLPHLEPGESIDVFLSRLRRAIAAARAQPPVLTAHRRD